MVVSWPFGVSRTSTPSAASSSRSAVGGGEVAGSTRGGALFEAVKPQPSGSSVISSSAGRVQAEAEHPVEVEQQRPTLGGIQVIGGRHRVGHRQRGRHAQVVADRVDEARAIAGHRLGRQVDCGCIGFVRFGRGTTQAAQAGCCGVHGAPR